MITRKLVQLGYEQGIVQLILDPLQSGIACQIGEHWFWFGGATAEEYETVEAYKQDIPEETIINEIYYVLEDFGKHAECEAEYGYYEAYLLENIHTIMTQEEYKRFLDALDIVCMDCCMDTEDGSVCESCPVRITCDRLEARMNNKANDQ